jgi:hypothetical protein
MRWTTHLPLLLLLLPWPRVDLAFLCLATDAFCPQPRAAVPRPQARPDPTRVRKIVPPALSHRSHACERCGRQGGFFALQAVLHGKSHPLV